MERNINKLPKLLGSIKIFMVILANGKSVFWFSLATYMN